MSTEMSDLLGALDRGERTYAFQCPQCDAFPFETAVDLAEHHFTVHVGCPIVEVTYIPTTSAPSAPPANRYTAKQDSFLRSLLSERTGNPAADAIRERLNQYRAADGYVTKAAASGAIDELLKIARNGHGQMGLHEAPTTTTEAPTVPAGRYAVTADAGHTSFYRVDTPEEGRWAGRTFVSLLLGSPGDFRKERLPFATQKAILAKIVADGPEAASVRFGREVGVCGRCGSPLTDETSRANGIGPVCATKGW